MVPGVPESWCAGQHLRVELDDRSILLVHIPTDATPCGQVCFELPSSRQAGHAESVVARVMAPLRQCSAADSQLPALLTGKSSPSDDADSASFTSGSGWSGNSWGGAPGLPPSVASCLGQAPIVDAVDNLRAHIQGLNEAIAKQEASGVSPRIRVLHTLSQHTRRRTSWLSTAFTSLRTLLPGRNQRTANDAAESDSAATKQEEDLARVAARTVLQPQAGRIWPMNDVNAIIVGCGHMGCGIAGELLRRGCTVWLSDVSEFRMMQARALIEASLRQFCTQELLLVGDTEAMLSRCFASDLDTALVQAKQRCVLLIEAVEEITNVKRTTLNEMAAACIRLELDPTNVLIGSNTMVCSVQQMTAEMPAAFAGRVVGLRFLHPCWFIDTVEITNPPRGDPLHAKPAGGEARVLLERLHFQLRTIESEHVVTGSYRRHLIHEEVLLHTLRQKESCEADARALQPAAAIAPAPSAAVADMELDGRNEPGVGPGVGQEQMDVVAGDGWEGLLHLEVDGVDWENPRVGEWWQPPS